MFWHPAGGQRWSAVLMLAMGCCGASGALATSPGYLPGPETTLEKYLPLAIAGDPDVQNFVGYMYFYGEGTSQDFDEAHYWFHRAADHGNPKAQLNLALLHAGANPAVPEPLLNAVEANYWFIEARQSRAAAGETSPNQDLDLGRQIYTTFCSGCHGLRGIAAYESAPSFAKGERLEKSDAQLLNSMLNGRGIMVAWRDTLPIEALRDTLAFVRMIPGLHDNELDAIAASKIPHDVSYGERLFTTFCAGCHGFNGIAYYVNAPSFALGERMEKSNEELLSSIANGKGQMPAWENMLELADREEILAFVRTLQVDFQSGIIGNLRGAPTIYFRFRPLGETGSEWDSADPGRQPLLQVRRFRHLK